MVRELVPPHLDQSITNGMPYYFNTPFGISNLVMETNNSGGRLLHANKELLAYVSHYFYNLLVAGNEPSKQDETITIKLDVDYSVMEMILRFVCNIERNYVKAGGYFVDCSQENIVNFVKAAKKFEFPRILEDLNAACVNFPSAKLAEAAIELGMSSEKTILIRRLGGGQLRKLIRKKSDVPVFSRADIKCFFDEMERNKTKTILNPEKITQFAKNALPIFNDVSIITFDGTIECNKSLLAVFSPYFKALFFSDFNDKCREKIEMDVSSENFSLLVEILVDKCAGTVDLKEKQCAELYKVADQYDFPCIREFCRQHFVNYNLASSLMIALLLDFKEQKANLIAKMKYSDFKTWYEESADNHMPLLSHNDLDALMQRCYATSPMYKCCERFSHPIMVEHAHQPQPGFPKPSHPMMMGNAHQPLMGNAHQPQPGFPKSSHPMMMLNAHQPLILKGKAHQPQPGFPKSSHPMMMGNAHQPLMGNAHQPQPGFPKPPMQPGYPHMQSHNSNATGYVQRSWHLQDDAEYFRKCQFCGNDQLTEAFREE